MSKIYEIICFTASSEAYARAIIKKIDPKGSYITETLARQHCMVTRNGFYIKDLRILKRKMENVIIVDNLVHSFGFQIRNGIIIMEWHDDPHDEELLGLMGYLQEVQKAPDVRVFNREQLKLEKIPDKSLDELVGQLGDSGMI